MSDADEIWTGDVVMVAYLARPASGGRNPRVIRVGLSLVFDAVGFLAVDHPMQCEAKSGEQLSARSLIGAF